MSEHLFKMHNVARNIKNKHDIDIMVPHGVKIGGKTFPAYNKYLHTTVPLPHLSFRIPLENGHVVFAYAHDDGKSLDGLRDIPAAAIATVVFPSESGGYGHLTEDGRLDGKLLPGHDFEIPRHGATEALASKIKEWSEQPTTGVRYRRDGLNEVVPPEELASHLQKHKEYKKAGRPPRHSNIIAVANHDEGNRYWDYNISTEEFKNTQGGD